jgi:hypothetical protein
MSRTIEYGRRLWPMGVVGAMHFRAAQKRLGHASTAQLVAPSAGWPDEVLILSGSMHDLGLQQTFSAGSYACRPPGMVHGPWTTLDACVMLEIQYGGDQA